MRWILFLAALLFTRVSFASKAAKPFFLPDNPTCIQAKNIPRNALFNLLDDTLLYPDLIEKVHQFKESIWHLFDPVIGPSIKALESRELLSRPEPNPKPITLDGDEVSEDQNE